MRGAVSQISVAACSAARSADWIVRAALADDGTMRRPAATTLTVLLLFAAAACKSDPNTRAPASPGAAGGNATDADEIGPAKYAGCGGQGGKLNQLAPAFLDKMDRCEAADTAPADKLWEMARDGSIIAEKGDCQFDHGISCHFHTSMEFVAAGKLEDHEHGVGEMHCIVPSAHSSSPTVFGAHVRCKAGTTPESGTRACSKELVEVLQLARCRDGWRCCDNGTLTKPIGKQSPAELKLRPDFRICQDEAIEVDCGLFHDMHGHTANVVGLGEEITGRFNAAHH
jgi:hypothetical protein